MKKILIGVLVLSSFSTYAKDFCTVEMTAISNTFASTYPGVTKSSLRVDCTNDKDKQSIKATLKRAKSQDFGSQFYKNMSKLRYRDYIPCTQSSAYNPNYSGIETTRVCVFIKF